MHWIPQYIASSELFFETTCVWTWSIKNELSLADGTFISPQKDCARVEKVILSQDIMQVTPTSIKGRYSIHAEMNAESLEYSYFP